MNETVLPPDPAEEESDEVVGVAFRWSLAVLGGLGLAGLAIWWSLSGEKPTGEVRVKDTGAIRALPETGSIALPGIPFRSLGPGQGIDFVHFSGARGQRLLPETIGGGVALFDHDNNGTLDILFVSGTNWPGDPPAESGASSLRLYSNDGAASFREITAPAGLTTQLHGMGCAIGDYDNDGWIDLFVSCLGGNRLYRNEQGIFRDVTTAAGVGGDGAAWSTAAGFFDYDCDGWLDLMVCNYVQWSPGIDRELNFTLNGTDRAYGPPTHYAGAHPWLYRNRGDGTFEEKGEAAGLRIRNPDRDVPVAKALGLLLVDLNDDGWDDIVMANDTVRNLMFLNRKDGTFEEVGILTGLAYDRTGRATGAMGIDIGHIFNDRTRAIAIGNFANEMTSVYVSGADGAGYVDEAAPLGIGAPTRQRLTFGTLWEDFDLDGRLDLLQVNGHLEDTISTVQPSQSYRQPPQLFWNKGQGSGTCFAELPAEQIGDLAVPIVGRGGASGDLDGDGDPDLVLTQVDGPARVLLNDQQSGNRYLRLRVSAPGKNRFGWGACVSLELGDQTATRYLSPNRSYLSQTEPVVLFGLGKSTAAGTVTVRWPGGETTSEAVPASGSTMTLSRPEQ